MKAADKIDQLSNQESSKEFADITNQNFDGLSSTTPMRWITGKSSVVRSSISLLQSISGSGKSTPNITPYKMMRKNKEGGKDGTTNISNLEIKIKELEEQIMQSKQNRIDDEEDEVDNEFLDGIQHINSRAERIKASKEETKEIVIEESPEKSLKSEASLSKNSKQTSSPESKESDREVSENLDIKELEEMLGQVYSTLRNKAGAHKQKEEIAYHDSINSSAKSSNNNSDEEVKTYAQASDAFKAKRFSHKRSSKPTKRRKSSRHKRKYDHIELFHDTSWWKDEWFRDNEVWTRARMRKKRVYQKCS